MPKVLIAESLKTGKRTLETSEPNLKAYIEKKAAKNEEDNEFLVLILKPERMVVSVVRALIVQSLSKLADPERDDLGGKKERLAFTLALDPSKQKGRWTKTPISLDEV